MQTELLKSDALGRIEIVFDGDRRWIRRDTRVANLGMRWFARSAAAREARVLRALSGVDGVPQLIAWSNGVLDRSYMEGAPMQQAQPRDPHYYRDAHRLLKRMRQCGVAHNDLAKEPNWLQRDNGAPAAVDFQIAWISKGRGRLFRLLVREDLRHLLKHKRTYCPQALTPVEKRVLARRSWIASSWRATGKRLYKFIARRLFGYWDNEGKGRVRR
ncbi:serine/threonine protein kinase [Dokdonella sp.]|uniref:serine/threonine protein kinase n=1 Tax=Dokdonella sp. TaxID=2291710 RepID=UPI003C4926FF